MRNKCRSRIKYIDAYHGKNLKYEKKKIASNYLWGSDRKVYWKVWDFGWIKSVEMIFQQKDKDKENNLETKNWFFTYKNVHKGKKYS